MSAGSPPARAQLEIRNRLGLHARAARLLVEAVRGFDADVAIGRDGQMVNGKSILELMMLAAGPGTVLDVAVVGPDAEAALAALTTLFEQRFHEEQ